MDCLLYYMELITKPLFYMGSISTSVCLGMKNIKTAAGFQLWFMPFSSHFFL